MAFSAVVVWQIGIKKFGNNVARESSAEYKAYEQLFMQENFQTTKGEMLQLPKVKAPLVVVNFWASWCIPCLDEMPSMLKLKKHFGEDKVNIVAINTDEDEQLRNIQKIQQQLKLGNEFIIVPDKSMKLAEKFKVSAIPVSIIYLNGRVVHVSNGPMDFFSEEFKGQVNQWLQ